MSVSQPHERPRSISILGDLKPPSKQDDVLAGIDAGCGLRWQVKHGSMWTMLGTGRVGAEDYIGCRACVKDMQGSGLCRG